MSGRTYIAIDLKSFYASVECVEHQLDPLNTNLVVADESRTEKTIVLAVSPSLKAFGLPGRPRLFEVIQQVDRVNNQRLYQFRKMNRNYSLQLGEPSHFASEPNSNPHGFLAAWCGIRKEVTSERNVYYGRYSGTFGI